MSAPQRALALMIGALLGTQALAQSPAAWRWPGAGDGYYGLQFGRAATPQRCGNVATPCTVNIPLLEKTAGSTEWKIVGRLGSPTARFSPATMMETGTGLAYGVGVSWDLTPNASATVGFDGYDYRFGAERDFVRATSLGLQWRY